MNDNGSNSSVGSITRRTAMGALAAAGVGFAVFGPRGRDEAARRAEREGKIVLDYWEKWTGDEGAAMQRVVNDFNASQDRIHVRYLVTNTIHQKALVAIAGKAPPDIIGMYSFNVPTYTDANAVMDLGPLASRHGLTLDDYAAGMRPIMQYAGQWTGIVNTGGTLALYYHKGVFRDAGLDPERPPRTVSEMDAAQRAITRRDAAGRLTRVGHLHIEPGWWSWIWGYYFGCRIWDEATDTCVADSPENVRAYEWVQRTAAELGHEEVERFRSGFGPFGTPQQAFLRGEVGMVVQGPWMANQIVAFAPELDYGVAPVPVADELYDPESPIACVDTDVLMIPRGAKDPEASMEFIAYTQRQEVVEYLATRHCKGSPLAEVSEGFLANHPNRGVRLHTELARSPRAFIPPPTPAWAEMKDVFDTSFLAIWKGEVGVEERLRVVRARCQGALDRLATEKARRKESSVHSAKLARPRGGRVQEALSRGWPPSASAPLATFVRPTGGNGRGAGGEA